jgi:hypothetical protein
MIAINKEAREYLVKLYQETKEKADKTTNEKDKDYFRGVLNTLSATAMEFGFNIVSGNVYDDEAKDVDDRLDLLEAIIDNRCENEGAGDTEEYLREFGINNEQLNRWGFDVPVEDDEDSYDPYEEDMKEYRSMCNDEAHYINSRR